MVRLKTFQCSQTAGNLAAKQVVTFLASSSRRPADQFLAADAARRSQTQADQFLAAWLRRARVQVCNCSNRNYYEGSRKGNGQKR
eukprot:SAG25_NODE_5109_length_701_cov_1.215947_2_plen_85_part_00